jgi:hypothetical protein
MIRPVFEKTLVRAGEVRSFQIHVGPSGWEVSERNDQTIARHRHADWHHVERTLTRFEDQIATLRSEGWRES